MLMFITSLCASWSKYRFNGTVQDLDAWGQDAKLSIENVLYGFECTLLPLGDGNMWHWALWEWLCCL